MAACQLARLAWAGIAASATRPAMSVEAKPLPHFGELDAALALVARCGEALRKSDKSGTRIVGTIHSREV